MRARLASMLADRNSLPRPVNALIDRVADRPTGLLGRLAALRYGFPRSSTPVTTFPPAGRTVLIAPVNYSGQAREWARVIEAALPDTAVRNMAIHVPGGFDFAADLLVDNVVYQADRGWQRRQFEAVASTATHVLIEAEEPPFGRLLGRSTAAQARALGARGVDVAFVAHGTDIRLPSRHVERTPWSHYRDPDVYVPRLEQLVRGNRAMLDEMGRPVFVSTPDLLADVTDGIWCPVVIDPARWAAADRPPRAAGAPLRVAHAPSVPLLKGTPMIMPAIERLQADGVIDFEQISGVASADMPAVFHRSDVLLDQFRAGSYGVGACEAMAAGCVVVGHVLPDVRQLVQEFTGAELPIVEATADTLEQELRSLDRDPARLEALKLAGVRFVNAVHDGRRSAQVLIEHWLSPPPTR